MPTRSKAEGALLSIIKSELELSDSALDDVLQLVAEYYEPEDVFKESQLERWAEANGYIKE